MPGSEDSWRYDSWVDVLSAAALFVLVLAYSAYIRHKPAGLLRFLHNVPVHVFLSVFPWSISSISVRGGIAFIFCWLANAKLLAHTANRGPLAQPGLSSWQYIALLLLPVTSAKRLSVRVHDSPKLSPWLALPLKLACFLSLSVALASSAIVLPDVVRHACYAVYIYFIVSLMLDSTLPLAQAVLTSKQSTSNAPGLQLQTGMNAPFLSTSIQEFWGSRYNLVVSATLADVVYQPIIDGCWVKPQTSAPPQPQQPSAKGKDAVQQTASGTVDHCNGAVSQKHAAADGQIGGSTAATGKKARSRTGDDRATASSMGKDMLGVAVVDAHAASECAGVRIRKLVALTAAFLVSGVMHEIIIWIQCKGEVKISGRMMMFFLAQPLIILVEQVAQQRLGWLQHASWLSSKASQKAWAVCARLVQVIWTAVCLLTVAEMFFWESLTTGCDIDKRGLAEVMYLMEQARLFMARFQAPGKHEL